MPLLYIYINQNTQDIFWTLFNVDKTKIMCTFLAYVAFNKFTNRQAYIMHDKAKTLSLMSLSMFFSCPH